jgi:peptidoglycan/LPS O-acetylase OafA/YrhL
MTASTSQRCRELDSIRGICALAVLLFHYTTRYPALFGDDAAPFRVTYGFFGVEVFYGISGFVILMTLARCRTAGDFVFARFLRLYPAYWVSVLVTFALMTLFPLPGRPVTWLQALANLTMLQEFLGIAHINGVYWSLEVELMFYAWMLVVLVLGGTRQAHRLLVAWLLVAITAYAASLVFARSVPILVNRVLILQHCAFFAIGAAACVDFQGGRISPATWIVFLLAPIAAWISQDGEAACVAVLMVALFTLLVWRKLDFLDTRSLVFLGAISYPLYLLHQNMGYIIIAGLRARHVGYGWAMLAATAVSLVAATALTFGIERLVGTWRARRVESRSEVLVARQAADGV